MVRTLYIIFLLAMTLTGTTLVSGCAARPSVVPMTIPPGPHQTGANQKVGFSPALGPAEAPVTLIVFSDFQCEHCKKLAGSLHSLHEEYPNELKIVFKHLPLPFHRLAKSAAQAAIAADMQGRFWEMHDQLFAHQSTLGPATFVQAAIDVGLNRELFENDMGSEIVSTIMRRDLALAKKWRIDSTPRMYVNGEAVSGAVPYGELQLVVERQLALANKRRLTMQ